MLETSTSAAHFPPTLGFITANMLQCRFNLHPSFVLFPRRQPDNITMFHEGLLSWSRGPQNPDRSCPAQMSIQKLTACSRIAPQQVTSLVPSSVALTATWKEDRFSTSCQAHALSHPRALNSLRLKFLRLHAALTPPALLFTTLRLRLQGHESPSETPRHSKGRLRLPPRRSVGVVMWR